VKVWDTTTGKENLTLHEGAAVLGVKISPDSLRIASGSKDGTVKIWAPPGNEPLTLWPENSYIQEGFRNAVFSPNGQQVAASCGDALGGRGPVIIWDVMKGTNLRMLDSCGYRVEWSPDGKYLGITEDGSLINISHEQIMGLHVLLKPMGPIPFYRGRRISKLQLKGAPKGPGKCFEAAFSPDGKLIAAAFRKGLVQTWDTATGSCLRTFNTGHDLATCVAFSPNGKLLAAGSGETSTTGTPCLDHEGLLKIWDLNTGVEVFSCDSVSACVWSVAFSRDGRHLAAAIGNFITTGGHSIIPGEVRVWDIITGQEIYSLRGHRDCVWSVSFSPDGKRLASAAGPYAWPANPGEVKIWDMNTGLEVCTLRGHSEAVYSVAFSPCGRRLATASADGTVKIWDGTPLAEPPRSSEAQWVQQ
jgi:hypothetical protein